MALCGEGVHGTRPFRDGVEGSSGVVVDGFTEERVPWTPADHRLTRRGRTVYAFQLAWPKDGRTVIRSTRSEDRVAAVRLLGHGPVPFDQVHPGGELVVDLPDRAPSRYVNALAIELGAP
ncbi:alpha-L-fucosidase C-terminal domain-containing protein [Streptomyces sp. DSM 44918]|uniref:Alpha-L-fucosidase C-terminal domain-containing protein n=2 Tax=Streptomyces millisiae TaxID=3075542 RepID=A0ABU2LLY5_9ACTN|nr:alpha-L-fucosidase C-terminal domain-containing protein [Streptomyces sp. DSM 44918]MDT0318594.1 alpha-L-fucosidase C-terminal domain-containing protein [Streptomyces sp. DSM 44918]